MVDVIIIISENILKVIDANAILSGFFIWQWQVLAQISIWKNSWIDESFYLFF